MWLNIKWYDANEVEMIGDEVGAYGDLPISILNPKDNTTFTPKSIVNLADPRLKVYEVHPAITQEWAAILVSVLPYHETTPLGFDRLNGAVTKTIGQLADQAAGTYEKSFHFALNNYVADDNRIPPYQMSYNEAQKRNALPVPDNQYGGSPGGVYEHWDEFDIGAMAPQGAASANLTLYYQGTSWEYVQFLYKAVDNTLPHVGTFLAEEGVNFLDAWVKTGMVPPYVMATASWGQQQCIPNEIPEQTCNDGSDNDCDDLTDCDDVDDCGTSPYCGECTLIEFPLCFDGLDNECDGLTDCADRTDCDGATETTNCGLGVCASTGSLACNNGTLEEITCTPGPQNEPFDTTCDGLDGDCDGAVDEDYIITPTSCGDGACASAGLLECQGGIEVDTCTPGLPSAETCNNIDDNCDLSTDEGCDDDGDGYCDDTMTVAGAPVAVCPASGDGSGDDCDDADHNIYPGGPAARIVGTPHAYYSIFQLAYDNTAPAGILQIQDHEFIEVLLLDDDKSVTLQAGYDCSYTTNTGKTIITGDMTINNGAVIIESGTLEVR
jgi:hypothetical protein